MGIHWHFLHLNLSLANVLHFVTLGPWDLGATWDKHVFVFVISFFSVLCRGSVVRIWMSVVHKNTHVALERMQKHFFRSVWPDNSNLIFVFSCSLLRHGDRLEIR